MAKSMSIKLEFVAPLPQIAITRFTYNAVEFYGPPGPRYKEVDLYDHIFNTDPPIFIKFAAKC